MIQSVALKDPGSETFFSDKSLIGAIGFSFFIGWEIIALFAGTYTSSAAQVPLWFGIMRAIMLFGIVLIFICYSMFSEKIEHFTNTPIFAGITVVSLLLVPICILVETYTTIKVPLPLIAGVWLIQGLATGQASVLWATFQSNIKESTVQITIVSACMIAGVIAVGVPMMSPPVNIIATALLPVASVLTLCYVRQGMPSSEAPHFRLSKNNLNLRKNGSFILTVDGAALGFCTSLLAVRVIEEGYSPIIFGLLFVAVAILFYLIAKHRPEFLSLESIQLISLPLLVGGLLLVLFTSGRTQFVITTGLTVILLIFNYSNLSILTLRGNLVSISPCYCFATGRIPIILGQSIGWSIGGLMVVFNSYKPIPSTIVIFVLIVLLTSYISITAAGSNKENLIKSRLDEQMKITADPEIIEQNNPDKRGRFKRQCATATEKYNLSPRESEIVFYLAKGRNAKFIADTLFVAERTVKTHIYHIYQKMGIHGQQELINIVDNLTE